MNTVMLIIGGLVLIGLVVWVMKKRTQNKEVISVYESMKQKAFPNGQKQIDDEASKLYLKLDGRLSLQEAKNLIAWAKALLIVGDDITPKRMYDSISRHENGKLNDDVVKIVHSIIVNFPTELYPSGNGSFDNMVHINTNEHQTGVHAEYRWISMRYGERDVDWKLTSQINGRKGDVIYDQLNIVTNSGEEYSFYFDITKFYPKAENKGAQQASDTLDQKWDDLEKALTSCNFEELQKLLSSTIDFLVKDYTSAFNVDELKLRIVFANIFVTLLDNLPGGIQNKENYFILVKTILDSDSHEVWQKFGEGRDSGVQELQHADLAGKNKVQILQAVNAVLAKYLHGKSVVETTQEQLRLRSYWHPISLFAMRQSEL